MLFRTNLSYTDKNEGKVTRVDHMLNSHASSTPSPSSATRGRFDAMVRFTHLAIAVCFFVVYFTGDDEALHRVHTTCGYSLLVLIVFRLLWQMMSAPAN